MSWKHTKNNYQSLISPLSLRTVFSDLANVGYLHCDIILVDCSCMCKLTQRWCSPMNYNCEYQFPATRYLWLSMKEFSLTQNQWIWCFAITEFQHIWGPFYYHGLTLIPVWSRNRMPSKVWDEITHLFPNFNGITIEVWEWMSNCISRFIMDVIIYSCWDWSYSTLVKGAQITTNFCTWCDNCTTPLPYHLQNLC